LRLPIAQVTIFGLEDDPFDVLQSFFQLVGQAGRETVRSVELEMISTGSSIFDNALRMS
jgi:hypothetical protein